MSVSMVTTVSVMRARRSFKLSGRGGTKLCLQHIPKQKNPGVCKSGDRSGLAIDPPRPIQATTVQLS